MARKTAKRKRSSTKLKLLAEDRSKRLKTTILGC